MTRRAADVLAEMRRRAARQAAEGRRLWQPAPQTPALLLVVDEYAELPEDVHPHADSIARLGRAVAVNLLAATQRPTQQAMGHGAVRSQMDNRICLRVRERRDTDLVLGQGMYAAGWRPDMLDAPGKFLISTPGYAAPRPARAYLMTDADVEATAARYASSRPALTVESKPPIAPVLHLPAADTEPERELIDALGHAPADGIGVAELVTATGRSRRWIYYRLRALAEEGRAERTERGVWRATRPNVDHEP